MAGLTTRQAVARAAVAEDERGGILRRCDVRAVRIGAPAPPLQSDEGVLQVSPVARVVVGRQQCEQQLLADVALLALVPGVADEGGAVAEVGE